MIVERCRASDLPGVTSDAMHRYSLFSSPAFAALWNSHGGTAACWICRMEDEVVSCLLGVEFRSRPLTRFQAMPDGLYARVFSATPEQQVYRESLAVLSHAIALGGYAKLFLSDFCGGFGEMPDWQMTGCQTVVIDISAAGWEPPDATIRSEIRKAGRESGNMAEFDTRRHMAGFLKLMRNTEERHGRQPKYSEQFYRDLADLASTDTRIKWVVTELGDDLAASHIYLVDGGSALYWQSFFDKKYSFLKPNQHMLYRTAVQLAAEGVSSLNLGGSPQDAEGLRNYKEKWGGKAFGYPLYVRKSWIGKLL